jgi:transposase, IS605 OrfB family, central region
MRTYKVKLEFENQNVKDFWKKRICLVQDCYNYASNITFNEKVQLGLKSVHSRLYYELRGRFKELPSQICIQVERALIANYKSVRSNGHHLDKPIQMKHPAIQLDKRLFSNLTRESFKLSNGDGNHRSEVRFVTYPKFDQLAEMYKMCDPKLTYDVETDVFHACVPFLDIPPTPHEDSYIGVDLGVKRLATLSDGTSYCDKEYLANRRRIRHNKRMLQSKKKHSHSARTKLKKLRRKEANVSKNTCHHLANAILKHRGSVVVMEDLTKIKQSTSKTKEGFKRKRHNNMLSQVQFYLIRQILTYKALLRGKRVETVSPEYTSRQDCRYGSGVGCKRQGCRFYTKDGMVFDADWNASINIMNRYKHSTSFELPIDGKLNLVNRLLQPTNSSVSNHRAISTVFSR